jgi:predicted amidohydrolase
VRLALVEVAARYGAPDETADRIIAATQEVAADLVVLPECALSGYVDPQGRCELAPFVEAAASLGEDLTLRASAIGSIARHARTLHTTWIAPLIERDAGGRLFNSVVAIDPTGRVSARHRKRHPWFPEQWATPGDEPFQVVSIAGREVVLAICFDVHFLEREAAAALRHAEVLVFPSAWVDDGDDDLRGPIFDRLTRRFGLVVGNANWGPGEPRVLGQGRSRIVRQDGRSEELIGAGASVEVLVRDV